MPRLYRPLPGCHKKSRKNSLAATAAAALRLRVCVQVCVCLACCLWAGSMNCRHLSALRSWQRCRRRQSDCERATILFLLIFLAHPSLDLLPDFCLPRADSAACPALLLPRSLLHGMAGVVCAGVAFKGFGLFPDNNNKL